MFALGSARFTLIIILANSTFVTNSDYRISPTIITDYFMDHTWRQLLNIFLILAHDICFFLYFLRSLFVFSLFLFIFLLLLLSFNLTLKYFIEFFYLDFLILTAYCIIFQEYMFGDSWSWIKDFDFWLNFFYINSGHFLVCFEVDVDILLGLKYDLITLLIYIVEREWAKLRKGLSDIGWECFQR